MRSGNVRISASSRSALVLVVVLAAAFGISAAAAQFEPGDVIVATARGVGSPGGGQTVSFIKTYSAGGTFKDEVSLPSGFRAHDLTLRAGSLLAAREGGGDIFRIATDGTVTRIGHTGHFTFDASGNLYTSLNTGTNGTIHKFDVAGNRVGTWSLPVYSAHDIDLAADQCTMYFQGGSSPGERPMIGRYDLCASQALPPLITDVSILGNLRVLPNNEVLLGTGTNPGILRISPNGQILQTYVGGPYIALDPDRRSFWEAGSYDRARKFDIASGNIVLETSPPEPLPFGLPATSLTVVGEPRAGLLLPGIPTLSEWLLVALAAAIAVAGVFRLRA